MLNPEACDGPAIYVKHFCEKVMWYGSITKMYQLLRGDFEIRNSTTCMREADFLGGEGCLDKCASSHIKRIVCLMGRKKHCCAHNSFRNIGLRIETRGRCAVLVALCHRKTAVENHGT
jgi:hypothetical protein